MATSAQIAPELESQADDSFEITPGKFMEVDYAEPHLTRGRRLLRKHPEIAKLFGRNPWTFVISVITNAMHIGLGIGLVMAGVPWWGLLIAAFLFGAIFSNMNSAIIHESSHDRVSKHRWINELTGWIANLTSLIPVSSSFRLYHMKHHRFQGDPELDADMASEWEANFYGSSFLGKLFYQFTFTIAQSLRTKRFVDNGRIPFMTKWVALNMIVVFAFDIAIAVLVSPWVLFYFAASFIFALGPHPVGARYVQEHYIFHKNQETYSYYGPLNAVTLNVYHHNEHHDFPAVPWHNLPKLRKMVPEVYGELYAHESLTKLWFRFLFDPQISLHRRIVRHYDFSKKRPSIKKVDKQEPAHAPMAAEAAE